MVLYRKVPGVQTPASVARLYFFLFLFLSPVLLLFLAGFFSRYVFRFAMINLMRLEPLHSERALMIFRITAINIAIKTDQHQRATKSSRLVCRSAYCGIAPKGTRGSNTRLRGALVLFSFSLFISGSSSFLGWLLFSLFFALCND